MRTRLLALSGAIVLGIVAAFALDSAAEESLQRGLIARWPLTRDARDAAAGQHHGRATQVRFTDDGATFDGRESRIDVPDHPALRLGVKDFSVSLWVNTQASLEDILGDLVAKYDPASRKGFSLGIRHNAGSTGSQANYRNLHFGIDSGRQEKQWRDEGRLGKAVFVHSMAVHNGGLYAGTCEGWTNKDQGHVYRYDGPNQWKDLGAPWRSNGVTAMASYKGHLYVGVSRVLLHYSGLEPTIAHHIGGKVFRYENGRWVDLGQLLGLDGVNGMVVFRDKLYVTGFYQPALFRYEGGTNWTSLGSPGGMRPEAMCVHNGAIYATGYDEGAVYRFDGEKWSRTGILGDATQVYGLAVYGGNLFAGTWPLGTVYRFQGDETWTSTGRLGESEEVMGPNVYNGKLYAGTLPLAEIYRFDGDKRWTSMGRVDQTPDVKYRRAWSMAVFKGRLFTGTLPSGHVRSFEAGKNATHDRELPPGWRHVSVQRGDNRLRVYLDGKLVAESSAIEPDAFDLTNAVPLTIGHGPQDSFFGQLRDVRIHDRALGENEIRTLARE